MLAKPIIKFTTGISDPKINANNKPRVTFPLSILQLNSITKSEIAIEAKYSNSHIKFYPIKIGLVIRA